MFNRFSLVAHSIVAGLGILVTIIVVAQGPDTTVALSPTRNLATQAGPPREIRVLLENQLSSLTSSLSGQRPADQPAGPGAAPTPDVTNPRVLVWPLLELACEHVRQPLLSQFSTEVSKFQPDPNTTRPGAVQPGAAQSSPPESAGRGNLAPADPNVARASAPAPGSAPALANAAPIDPNTGAPAMVQTGMGPDPQPAGPLPGQPVDPNARPVVPIRAWDPNKWTERCSCYERMVSNYPEAMLKVAVANQIGIFLSQQRQLQDATKWFAHILPDAEKLGLDRCVRLNMALTDLDLAQTATARSKLQTILDNVSTAGTDPLAWGAYLLAAGIMSNIEQVEGQPEPALQCLEQARRRLEALAAQLPNEAWPTFYLGMVHVWKLRIAAENAGPQPRAALAALYKEFLQSVPLGRWTWLQHQVFRDTVEPPPAPSPRMAAPQQHAPEDQP